MGASRAEKKATKNRKAKEKEERSNGNAFAHKREITFKEAGQEYGKVTKLLGNCRMQILCDDGHSRLGHIRGVMRKRGTFIRSGDWVLVSLRDFQDDRCDILQRYTINEVSVLKAWGEITGAVGVPVDEDDVKFELDAEDDGEGGAGGEFGDGKEQQFIDDI